MMNMGFVKKTIVLSGFLLGLSACNFSKGASFLGSIDASSGSGVSPGAPGSSSVPGGTTSQPVPGNQNPYAAGIGATLTGTGAISTPTAKGIIQRMSNVMGMNPPAGNFRQAMLQLNPNLSNTTDPTQFSGGDSVMRLAYAACIDAVPSKYGVNIALPLATVANQATLTTNLVGAGMTILNGYTAGIASQGSDSAQVNAQLLAIVKTSIANGASTRMAFNTICTAANTAGNALLGN